MTDELEHHLTGARAHGLYTHSGTLLPRANFGRCNVKMLTSLFESSAEEITAPEQRLWSTAGS